MITEEGCQNKSDEQLVELALADPDTYACLVNRYTDPLRRYVTRLGCRTSDADDVLQDVFLNAYLHLNDFDPKLKFSSWVYRIAHNQAISHFRKLNVRPTVELTDLEPWQELASDVSLGGEIDQAMLLATIRTVLDRLDPKYREVLVLKFLEEKDYAEISDILKKPMGTIATLLNRAKKQFRQLAAGHELK